MATITGSTVGADWSTVSLLPADSGAAVADFTAQLSAVSGPATITQHTDSTLKLSISGAGTLTIKGSGFITGTPVVKSIVWANGLDGFTIAGTFSLTSSGDVKGKITSVTIKDDGESVTLSGSISFNSGTSALSGTFTKVSWKDGDDAFSVSGTFSLAGGDVNGTVKGFSFSLADGSKFSVSGLSINMDAFDSVETVDDLLLMLPANLTGDDSISFSADGTALLAGGLGNDTYTVTSADQTVPEMADAGNDTVRIGYNVGTTETPIDLEVDFLNVENVVIVGTGLFNVSGSDADNKLTGNGSANELEGGEGNDTLTGGSGNDTLDGGLGADTMLGGKGNDVYVVDDAGDIVTEKLDEGTDTVQSSVTRTLGSHQENLILTGAAVINGTGNSLNNRIDGESNSAANTLTGGAGNDTYIVGAGDAVVETSSTGGTDTVISSVDFTLGANVERLVLDDPGGLAGTGNTGANRITGGAGNDTLDGGAGNDTLIGGGGDDLYIVDRTGDVITEALDAGEDSVQSSATFVLGANVDHLTLTGAANVNGTGNGLGNEITGNSGNNSLSGGAGNDVLEGGVGNDTLNGGAGNDELTGGDGADRFLFNLKPNALTNVDTIVDFDAAELDRLAFDNDVFTKLGAKGALAASRFHTGAGLVEVAAGGAGLVYDSSTGDLYYDSNGATVGGAVLVAQLSGMPALTAADIIVLE